MEWHKMMFIGCVFTLMVFSYGCSDTEPVSETHSDSDVIDAALDIVDLDAPGRADRPSSDAVDGHDAVADDVALSDAPDDDSVSGDGAPSDVASPPDGALVDTSADDDGGGPTLDATEDGTAPVDIADANDLDAGSEVGSNWPTNAVEGQCASNADCDSGLCNVAAPGGLCQGCGGVCAGNYECNFGTCNQYCSIDADCPIGLRCLTSQGVCVSISCSDSDECTAPYVCTSGQCQRPSCDVGECPTGWSCSAGSCVEPYWTL